MPGSAFLGKGGTMIAAYVIFKDNLHPAFVEKSKSTEAQLGFIVIVQRKCIARPVLFYSLGSLVRLNIKVHPNLRFHIKIANTPALIHTT